MAHPDMMWKTRWSFSPFLVAVSTIVQTTLFLWGFSKVFPQLWIRQLQAGFWANALVFFAVSFFQLIVEWGGHRWIMHMATISWLIRLVTFSHRKHHAITKITLSDANPGGTFKRVHSQYVIDKEEQHYAIAFGNYFLAAFFFGYNLFIFFPLHLLFPGAPIFLAGNLLVATWIPLYEILHPLEHKPDEWWESRKNNPILSRLHRVHQAHHLDTSWNSEVVGWFGIPVLSPLLGTFKLLPMALRDGDVIPVSLLAPPKFSRLVRKIDAWAAVREKRLLIERGEKKNSAKRSA